jgi:hypothetical protein
MSVRPIHMHSRTFMIVSGMAVLCSLATGPAAADLIVGEMTLITVEASSGPDSGQATWTFPPGLLIAGRYDWSLPESVPIRCGDKTLGTVESLDLSIDVDPEVKLSFVVTAGPSGTAFTIASAVIPFAALTNPLAFATAAVTVTDADGDGASLTGSLSGSKAYEAAYNAAPVTWALLVDPVIVAPDFSNIGQERKPASGMVPIADTLTSIRSQFSFALSANDLASGTSKFEVVVPEPATMALLALGTLGLAALRRRQK